MCLKPALTLKPPPAHHRKYSTLLCSDILLLAAPHHFSPHCAQHQRSIVVFQSDIFMVHFVHFMFGLTLFLWTLTVPLSMVVWTPVEGKLMAFATIRSAGYLSFIQLKSSVTDCVQHVVLMVFIVYWFKFLNRRLFFFFCFNIKIAVCRIISSL